MRGIFGGINESKTMLSEEHLKKFKALYQKRFGKELTDQEALEKGTKLVNLVKLLYKPMTKAEFDQLAKRREETKNL